MLFVVIILYKSFESFFDTKQILHQNFVFKFVGKKIIKVFENSKNKNFKLKHWINLRIQVFDYYINVYLIIIYFIFKML